MKRQLGERAGAANELDLSRRDRHHSLEVPDERAGRRGHPPQAQTVLHRDVGSGEDPPCSQQRRGRGGASLGDHQGQAVEQQVDRARITRERGQRLGGEADLTQLVCAAERGRAPRLDVGLAGELRFERHESRGGLQQQRRSLATQARDEREIAAHEVQPGASGLVEWPGVGGGEQRKGGVEGARLKARLGRGQGTLRTSCRVHRQCDGALQERRRRSESAASLRPAGRSLELVGDLLAGPRGGLGAVPRPPIGVDLSVGCFGEGAMHSVAVGGGGRAVDRGTYEWVGELDATVDLEQSGVHCRPGCGHVEAERHGGTVEQHEVAERLRGRGEGEQLCIGGQKWSRRA